jgi:hypothetical protein
MMETTDEPPEILKFDVDENGRVRAHLRYGGWLETQTVEAHLMLAILREMEKLNANEK